MKHLQCLIHVVYFEEMTHYSTPEFPTVLTLATRSNSRPKFKNIESLVFRSTSIQCTATFLLLSKTKLSSMPRRSFFTRFAIGRRKRYGIFPKYYFVVVNSDSNFHIMPRGSGRLIDSINSFLNFRHESAPPIFVLVHNSLTKDWISPNSELSIPGWFICWYCSDSKSSSSRQVYIGIQFTCSSVQTCYQDMMRCYRETIRDGKAILWKIPKGIGKAKIKGESPFKRKKPLRLRLAISKFLETVVNITGRSLDYMKDIPVVDVLRLRVFLPSRITFVSTTPSFKFITPDSIYMSQVSFGIFLSPLDAPTWYCLIGILMVISACRLIGSRVMTFSTWLSYIYWMFSVLMEQCEELREGTDGFIPIRKLAGFWLVMSTVFLHLYRASLKSDFAVPVPYETKLKYLNDLVGFELYLLLENSWCDNKIFKSWENETQLMRISYICNFQVSVERFCEFFLELQSLSFRLKHEFGVTTDLEEQKLLLSNLRITDAMMGNTQFMCQRDVTKLLSRQPSPARLAFIVAEGELDFQWTAIQDELRSASPPVDVKLAHNRQVRDDFLNHARGFIFTGGMSKYHHWVPDRLRTLVISGIYGLWEKWDEIRFKNSKLHNRNRLRISYQSLAFHNSHFHLVFLLWVLGTGASSVTYFMEILIFFVPFKKFRLGLAVLRMQIIASVGKVGGCLSHVNNKCRGRCLWKKTKSEVICTFSGRSCRWTKG
ncbi:unnamed protein product [Allacma fusca]|uniref:Uncharacterized protein n=1 Tax=Allacma fusca TaxID=39272 RepID=A0A8J2PCW6_9HEXA|nr:unnamed protein product [Allacma fusca]